MKQLGIVLVFGLGVGVGCAAGTAVQTQVAEAQAPAGVTRWEVRCAGGEHGAAKLGTAGWEPYAVVIDNMYSKQFCFRRQLP